MSWTKGGSTQKYIWPWMRMICRSERLLLKVPEQIVKGTSVSKSCQNQQIATIKVKEIRQKYEKACFELKFGFSFSISRKSIQIETVSVQQKGTTILESTLAAIKLSLVYLFTFNHLKTIIFHFGRVAERPNAPVLKTGVLHGTVGSNPTSSANASNLNPCSFHLKRRGYRCWIWQYNKAFLESDWDCRNCPF